MRATRIATLVGRGIAGALVVGGVILLFLPEWRLNGIWFLVLGFLLYSAASSSYRQAMVLDALKGFTAQDVMTRDSPMIPRNFSIREIVQRYVIAAPSQSFLVVDGESVGGLLTLQQIKGIPREEWDIMTAGQAMTPVEKLRVVRPGDQALRVLQRMEQDSLNEVAVAREGRVIGVIMRDNLIRFAQRLQGLSRR